MKEETITNKMSVFAVNRDELEIMVKALAFSINMAETQIEFGFNSTDLIKRKIARKEMEPWNILYDKWINELLIK